MDSEGSGPQPTRAPTIYDVAEAAGVAPSTVSRTFARPGRVNSRTAERIRAAATELGYRTTPVAQAPATSRTGMIAVLVSDLANPIHAELLRGAQVAASAAGYGVLVEDTREDAVTERGIAERIVPLVEGVLLSSSRMSDAAIRGIAKQRPVVVLNRGLTDVACVVADEERGTRRAVEHLGEAGHRDLAYVAGPDASWPNGARWRAFSDACHELSLTGRRIGPFDPTFAGGFEAALALSGARATGVVVFNALMAVGVIRGLQQAGLRVPEDVSVVGFDDVLIGQVVSPALTTVSTPLQAMGATALRNLLALVNGARSHGRPVVVPARLMPRDSSGPAPVARSVTRVQ
ncbi:LacI family transcriptional regulator [Cellulomonas hominis]|uniref:LacI family transcriptional regulator n=1 Tax=Cellulomonas hominis TaxID=156981 RepID=A0A511FAA4_9CELL|nr:LacI family DNA-binding transcriptional regulator [Cellulomonas hominis]MBB5472070.1 LacI family transcriptional regulator [Cellulomonas hominis]NKY06715.1 LacI family transcriptional regulator [Cellulomonas hominis]GEL46196.1 LacI family transcriptional regulator [Cellulomonas hominis]